MVTKPWTGAVDSKELRETSQKLLLDSSVNKHKCQGRTNKKKLQKCKRVETRWTRGFGVNKLKIPGKAVILAAVFLVVISLEVKNEVRTCCDSIHVDVPSDKQSYQGGVRTTTRNLQSTDPDKVPKRRQRQGRGHQKQLVTERKPKKTKFCSSGTKWTKLKDEVCPTSSEKGEREQATKTCTHSFSLLKCGHVFLQNSVSEKSTGDVHRNWLRFSRGRGVKVY